MQVLLTYCLIISKNKNVIGAIVGTIAGILLILWLSLSGMLFGESSIGNSFHTYLTIVFGTIVIFLIGFLISLFSSKKSDLEKQ